jgi:DNA topoisomerase-1
LAGPTQWIAPWPYEDLVKSTRQTRSICDEGAQHVSSASGVRLVIVESPAKAKTIQRYLGPGYRVEASVGHIRDLPEGSAQVPADFRDKSWARLAVDVEGDFTPIYVVSPAKKSKVAELRSHLKDADELLLATDEDREGEAIAWHLLEVLKPKVPVRRMVFNEITPEAISYAASHTRELDQDLVDAQETRRVIDRLYGYEVSPVLWRKIRSQLSAGRVQSVAVRLLVMRERERIAFRAAEYWGIDALAGEPRKFASTLTAVNGTRIAVGRDFGRDGQLRTDEVLRLDAQTAEHLADALRGQPMRVADVVEKPSKRSPAAPFTTSTLQQEASRKKGWGAQRTMRVAQSLYDRGYITYMRTDSTTLSDTAIAAARRQADELFGADHVASAPRRYKSKAKNAQEAHEAVRPAGDHFRTPGELAGELVGDEFALYELIWRRTLASQMADAKVATTTVTFGVTADDGRECTFSASGTVVVFPGFLAAYEEGTDDEDKDGKASTRLPQFAVGEVLTPESITPIGHATKPPARYTEASLVKHLEANGIGRPSTYAAIISTVIDRGYVRKRGTALIPTWLGFAVVRLLEDHFSALVDFDFTARMEEILDMVSRGEQQRPAVLRRFYFGDGQGGDFPGLHPLIVSGGDDIDPRANATFPIPDSDSVVRVGKFGAFVESGERKLSIPDELAPDELTADKVEELLAVPSERELGVAEDTGRTVVVKSGRYGPYVTEILTETEAELTPRKRPKPRTSSLLSTMTPESVTLEQAMPLLNLPRLVGEHPTDGEPITSHNGRYGPYISHSGDSRSLPDEESIFAITLDEALSLLAQPKQRGRRAADPGRVVGTDPNSNGEIRLKSGRYGPYVTDGETNASLRAGDEAETLSLERAVELLADRRAAGPAKKTAKKATAKKATGKKAPAKKTPAKKTTVKKATAKKPAAKKTPAKKATASKAAAKQTPVQMVAASASNPVGVE